MLSCVAVFQLVTLPVELDASKRAMALVYEEGFVVQEEQKDVKAMLSAAAFTYIASLISSVLQILRLLLIFNRNRD